MEAPSAYRILRKNGLSPAQSRAYIPFLMFGLFVAEFGLSRVFGFASIWSYLNLTVE